MPEIELKKIDEFFRTKGELDCRAFNVFVNDRMFGKKSFAFLYIDLESYTFAWNGFIDFSIIETTVLHHLPAKLFPLLERIQPSNSIIKSMFTFSDATQEGSDFIIRYNSYDNDQEKEEEFQRAIHSNWRNALFARYDINVPNPCRSINYSFTAENAHHPRIQHKFCELAIKQPIYQKMSTALIEWIYNCHSESFYYRNHLNPKNLLQKFNEILYSH